MHIQEFAALTGLSADTLRFYEKEGLLAPARDGNGYRIYSERDVAWLAFVLRLKETNCRSRKSRNLPACAKGARRRWRRVMSCYARTSRRLLRSWRVLSGIRRIWRRSCGITRRCCGRRSGGVRCLWAGGRPRYLSCTPLVYIHIERSAVCKQVIRRLPSHPSLFSFCGCARRASWGSVHQKHRAYRA